MNRRLYALHRWLSAAAFLQLAIWTLSGAFFAMVPIETVRGPFVQDANVRPLEAGEVVAPGVALGRAAALGLDAPTSLELRASPAGRFWLVRAKNRAIRLSAESEQTAPITHEETEATARRDQPASPAVHEAHRLEAAPVELRGKPLPAWRVEFDDAAHTVVYVDATSGEVTARRSDLWRVYDFLWSLHIMDYRERESFNHLLIRGASVLAVLTVFSGVVLWVLRARRWWRERT
ncbi:MAG: PepSY domain-containing protein [Myxococcales bacterium]|nr:PepSY domain-containing protein [Myxococcales bacterium]